MYILNLERQHERWTTITDKLKEVNNNLAYYQFNGIDASKINPNEMNNYVPINSKRFFMTPEIYAKARSHHSLWKNIVKEHSTKIDDNDTDAKKWFIILEDDAIIPDNFNEYIKSLEGFLNEIPSSILEATDIFNLSPTGDYHNSLNMHNKVMKMITKIGCLIKKKRQYSNDDIFNTDILQKKWSVINSNFPLCTHAYLVNIKQLKNLVTTLDTSKIYYHLDWMLNFEHLNINTILPIEIKRGGFDDATTSTLSNPAAAVKIFTMLHKELACDLGKPMINIIGFYQVNILIILYIIFILVWKILDIPSRLNDFFNRV